MLAATTRAPAAAARNSRRAALRDAHVALSTRVAHSSNEPPKSMFARMLRANACGIGVVRLDSAIVRNGGGERRAFGKMARGVFVTAGPALRQSEIDHGAQQDRRSQRMLLGECVRGGGKDLVTIAVQFRGPREGDARGPLHGRPPCQE